jgi:hypothetical protein
MYRNTFEADHVFVTDQPDWSQPVRYWETWETAIQVSKNNTEQRNSRRSRPLYSIAYAIRGMNTLDWGTRRMAALREMASAIVVPLWTVPETLDSVLSDTVTLTVASLAKTAFQVGGYAFFEQSGLASVFRVITAIGTDTITLASGNAVFPDIAVPSYTSGALVYPCIIGQRNENSLDSRMAGLEAAEEILYVQELGLSPTLVGS